MPIDPAICPHRNYTSYYAGPLVCDDCDCEIGPRDGQIVAISRPLSAGARQAISDDAAEACRARRAARVSS